MDKYCTTVDEDSICTSPKLVVQPSGESRKRKRVGHFTREEPRKVVCFKDTYGDGGSQSLCEKDAGVLSVSRICQNRTGAKPRSNKFLEPVDTVDVNGVFFMRNSNSLGMYEFGIAKQCLDGLRISNVKGDDVISSEQLAEVIYIRILPEGLVICLPKAGKGAGVYQAVLVESVYRICNTTRIRVRVSATGARKIVPISEVKIFKQELNYFINQTTSFLPVFSSDNVANWNQLDKVRNDVRKDSLPHSKQSGNKRKHENDNDDDLNKNEDFEQPRKRHC